MANGKKRSRPPELVQQNELLSADIDTRLARAIEKLRADRTLAATEHSLAKLAGCSRGTVRSRAKVMTALQGIKDDRKAAKPTPAVQKVTNLRDEIDRLKSQLHAARDETLVQFNLRESLEEKYRQLQNLYALQAAHLKELGDKLAQLGGTPPAVVPFKRKLPPKR
jgi:chromosome segregation ATPase